MSEKVEGIVLDAIKFKENSVIAKIFTRDRGLVSILVNGLGGRKTKLSFAYLQPLSHIECQLYFKESRAVNKASELVVVHSPFGTVNNIVRSSIAVFVAEIVIRTTKNQLKDYNVFDLLLEVVNVLSSEEKMLKSLHVYFLARYLAVLGFPVVEEHAQVYFKDEFLLDVKLRQLSNFGEFSHLEMTKHETKMLLNHLLSSLRSHLGMFDIQSYRILEEVMA